MTINRCPACGYSTDKSTQKVEVRHILATLPTNIKQKLITIYKYLLKFHNVSRLNNEWNTLMYTIDHGDLKLVNLSIDKYNKHKHYKDGKSFSYLKKMIIEEHNFYSRSKKLELSKHGANPPLIDEEVEDHPLGAGFAHKDTKRGIQDDPEC